MNKTIIKVPFGAEGFKECKEKSKINGKLDGKKLFSVMFDYQIDGLMKELKNQGYRRIGRSRIMFEEACDWQARFNNETIINYVKQRKVPQYVIFTLEHSIPKVE